MAVTPSVLGISMLPTLYNDVTYYGVTVITSANPTEELLRLMTDTDKIIDINTNAHRATLVKDTETIYGFNIISSMTSSVFTPFPTSAMVSAGDGMTQSSPTSIITIANTGYTSDASGGLSYNRTTRYITHTNTNDINKTYDTYLTLVDGTFVAYALHNGGDNTTIFTTIPNSVTDKSSNTVNFDTSGNPERLKVWRVDSDGIGMSENFRLDVVTNSETNNTNTPSGGGQTTTDWTTAPVINVNPSVFSVGNYVTTDNIVVAMNSVDASFNAVQVLDSSGIVISTLNGPFRISYLDMLDVTIVVGGASTEYPPFVKIRLANTSGVYVSNMSSLIAVDTTFTPSVTSSDVFFTSNTFGINKELTPTPTKIVALGASGGSPAVFGGAIWNGANTTFSSSQTLTEGNNVFVTFYRESPPAFNITQFNLPAGGGSGGNIPCFLAGAPVMTPSGYQRIETLTEGDMVTTSDGRSVAIQRVKRTLVTAGPETNPYVIPKGRFGATRRLLISPNHKVQTDEGRMVEAKDLGLRQETQSGQFIYYNLELPSWSNDKMVVAGVTVESLAPVRRIAMPLATLKALVAKQYGTSAAHLERVLRACSFLPNGLIEAPMLRKSQA
jgi:hypothetical protein